MKNLPKLSLNDLLRRRKQTLAKFVSELEITSHDDLVYTCNRMGVLPPGVEGCGNLFVTAQVSPELNVVAAEPVEESTQRPKRKARKFEQESFEQDQDDAKQPDHS